jgi:TolA protein
LESLFHLHQHGFNRFISVSLIAHVVVLALALILAQTTHKKIFITPTYTRVNLIAPTVKKRLVPAIKATKQARVKKPVAIKKKKAIAKKKVLIPAKKKTVALKKKKAVPPPAVVENKVSIDDAISRLEKKAAAEEEDLLLASVIKDLAKKTEADEREKEENLAELRAELEAYEEEKKSVAVENPMAEQLKSSANAYEGLSSELFELEFKSYYNKVGAKIQSRWIYTRTSDAHRLTLINIKIHKNGTLLDYKIEKRSGDAVFDEHVTRAIEKAAPFEPLPPDFNEEFLDLGIRFCPGGCVKE